MSIYITFIKIQIINLNFNFTIHNVKKANIIFSNIVNSIYSMIITI